MEITDGVHLITGAKGQNIYLLVGDDLTLVDSGYPGNGRRIVEYIERIGRSLDELKAILLTHSHPDHTGSVPELKDMAPGMQVMAHPADTSVDKQGRHVVSYLNVFGGTRLPVPFLRRVEADGFLEEGDVLPILGGLRVIHTPGHTPGSVCFYLESQRAIFVGDNVVNLGEYVGASMPFPKTSMRQYEKSLRRIAAMEFDIACLAHGQVFRENADRRIRRMIEWYLDAPMWLRLVRVIPRAFRLGRQSGFRET